MPIIRNDFYIPHQAIILTQQDNACDFSLKKVWDAYQRRRNLIGHKQALWELEIHPTNNCCLSCAGCSYGSRHNGQYLTYDEVCSIVRENSQYDLKSIFFSGGGDPLCWNYWQKFLRCVPKQIRYGISTNLYGLNNIKDNCSAFDFYQIHVVGFDKKECIRNAGKDVFETLDFNLHYLFGHRNLGQNITLKILVNKENYRLIPLYLSYVMKLNADSIVLKYQQDFLRNRDLADEEIIKSVRNLVYEHSITRQYDCLIDNLDDMMFTEFPEARECYFAKSGLYKLVDARGKAFPCIAANAYGDDAALNENSHDIYTQIMKDKKCPIKACRHYRFSQYISQVLSGNILLGVGENKNQQYLL